MPLELSEAVAQLDGLTADEIAHLMRAAKIRGVMQEPGSCPLAVWFNRVVDDHPDVSVEEQYVSDVNGLFDWPLPQGAQEFVTHFDTGHYRYLVAS